MLGAVVAKHPVHGAEIAVVQIAAGLVRARITGAGELDRSAAAERIDLSHRVQAAVSGGIEVGAGGVQHQDHVWRHGVQRRDQRSGGKCPLDHDARLHRLGKPEGAGDSQAHIDRQRLVGGLVGNPADLLPQLLH